MKKESEGKKPPHEYSEEDKRNLAGVFKILLEIDQRLHPEKYPDPIFCDWCKRGIRG